MFRILTFVSIGVFLLVEPRTALHAQTDATQADPADSNAPRMSFKEFLANPPVIADLFAVRKALGQTTYLHLRWQSNAVYLAKSLSPISIEQPGGAKNSFVSVSTRYDNLYQLKSFNGFFEWADATGNEEMDNKVIKYYNDVALPTVRELLTFGSRSVPVGGVAWNGDEFGYLNTARDWVPAGRLKRNEEGQISGMDLKKLPMGKDGDYNWSIDYFYETIFPRVELPSRIRKTAFEAGKEILSKDTEIKKLIISNAVLPKESYVINPKGFEDVQVVGKFENGILVQENLVTGEQQAITDTGVTIQRKRNLFSKVMMLFIFMSVALLPLILWRMARREHRK